MVKYSSFATNFWHLKIMPIHLEIVTFNSSSPKEDCEGRGEDHFGSDWAETENKSDIVGVDLKAPWGKLSNVERGQSESENESKSEQLELNMKVEVKIKRDSKKKVAEGDMKEELAIAIE